MILFLMLLNKNSAYDSEVPCMDEHSLIRKVMITVFRSEYLKALRRSMMAWIRTLVSRDSM